jgi:hypothetical protein
MNLKKLDMMKTEFVGFEGFVFEMWDGNFFKWKTDWWRRNRNMWRKKLAASAGTADSSD